MSIPRIGWERVENFAFIGPGRNSNQPHIDLSPIKNPSRMMRDAMALLNMFCTVGKVFQSLLPILVGEFRKNNNLNMAWILNHRLWIVDTAIDVPFGQEQVSAKQHWNLLLGHASSRKHVLLNPSVIGHGNHASKPSLSKPHDAPIKFLKTSNDLLQHELGRSCVACSPCYRVVIRLL